ncbi:hemin uptake protein HemP [Dokdonella sp.]|uniref:hemin uptake protein HemP n=1 Tax=Dokdonella sp. TaxID=2291710 RepID=UPI002F3EEC44
MLDSTSTAQAFPLDADAPAAARPVAITPRAARISSSTLLAGGRELVIDHAGQEYHLRLTRNDKLILTK